MKQLPLERIAFSTAPNLTFLRVHLLKNKFSCSLCVVREDDPITFNDVLIGKEDQTSLLCALVEYGFFRENPKRVSRAFQEWTESKFGEAVFEDSPRARDLAVAISSNSFKRLR